jgi:hypothetical protein
MAHSYCLYPLSERCPTANSSSGSLWQRLEERCRPIPEWEPRQAARCGRLTPAPLLEIREARSCTTPVDTIHENPRPQFFWSKARRKLSRQAVTLLRRRTAIMARHRAHRSSNGIFIAICRASATASGS